MYPERVAHLPNQPNVNYKWKIFIFVERAVDGDYDDGCLVGIKKKKRGSQWNGKRPEWLLLCEISM